MTEKSKEETTPDELMEHFKGRSLKTIIIFTVIVHAVLLIGTSIPSILKSVAGGDTSEMSEKERIDKAVREAQESLREIAEDHGIKPQDLSSQFAGGTPRKAPAERTPAEPVTPTSAADGPATVTPDEPKSTIEKELDVKADGPSVPKIEDEEEDLFK